MQLAALSEHQQHYKADYAECDYQKRKHSHYHFVFIECRYHRHHSVYEDMHHYRRHYGVVLHVDMSHEYADKEGKPAGSMEVFAQEVEFLSSGTQGGQAQSAAAPAQAEQPSGGFTAVEMDELPF